MSEHSAETALPFRLPRCARHFYFNKWWCRACQREVARQFEEVYDAFWRSDRRYNDLADRVEAKQFDGLEGGSDA